MMEPLPSDHDYHTNRSRYDCPLVPPLNRQHTSVCIAFSRLSQFQHPPSGANLMPRDMRCPGTLESIPAGPRGIFISDGIERCKLVRVRNILTGLFHECMLAFA